MHSQILFNYLWEESSVPHSCRDNAMGTWTKITPTVLGKVFVQTTLYTQQILGQNAVMQAMAIYI